MRRSIGVDGGALVELVRHTPTILRCCACCGPACGPAQAQCNRGSVQQTGQCDEPSRPRCCPFHRRPFQSGVTPVLPQRWCSSQRASIPCACMPTAVPLVCSDSLPPSPPAISWSVQHECGRPARTAGGADRRSGRLPCRRAARLPWAGRGAGGLPAGHAPRAAPAGVHRRAVARMGGRGPVGERRARAEGWGKPARQL